MIKPILTTALLLTLPLQAADKLSETWLKLSIASQNAGYRIQMLGVDAGEPDPKEFSADIKTIDSLLDTLVAKGLLKTQRFELKPELDIEDSVVKAVAKLAKKHESQYGAFVIREMLDIGTRQYLSEFQEDAPLVLNVRLPEDFLREFTAILKKHGFNK